MSSALHVVFDNKYWTKLSTDSLWWLVRYLKKIFALVWPSTLVSLKYLKFNMGQGKEGCKGAWNYGKREKDETGFIGIMSRMNSQS